MPYRLTPPISAFAWGMTVLSVVMSVFILLHSYKSAAKGMYGLALRAKPPSSGKRILLERDHVVLGRGSALTRRWSSAT